MLKKEVLKYNRLEVLGKTLGVDEKQTIFSNNRGQKLSCIKILEDGVEKYEVFNGNNNKILKDIECFNDYFEVLNFVKEKLLNKRMKRIDFIEVLLKNVYRVDGYYVNPFNKNSYIFFNNLSGGFKSEVCNVEFAAKKHYLEILLIGIEENFCLELEKVSEIFKNFDLLNYCKIFDLNNNKNILIKSC